MKETGLRNGAHGADKFGLKNLAAVHWNLPDTILVEHAIANREGELVQGGAFCAETGVHTGRSPKDKFVVADERRPKRPSGGKRTAGSRRSSFSSCSTISSRTPRARRCYAQDLYGGADREIPHQGPRL